MEAEKEIEKCYTAGCKNSRGCSREAKSEAASKAKKGKEIDSLQGNSFQKECSL